MMGQKKKEVVLVSKTGDGMTNEAGKSYGDLIREYRKKKGLSQEQLGEMLHVKKNAVGAWEAGRSRPDVAGIPVLCRELSMPISTFFGLGREEDDCGEVVARYIRLNDYNRRVVLNQMDMLYDLQCSSQPEPQNRKLVKIYNSSLSAAAGVSYGIGEDEGKPVYLVDDPITRQANIIINVSGDSMEPTFHDGDRVLVKKCNSLREGEIGIFITDDMGYIKEYRKEGLLSHNRAYPMMHFSEFDQVKVYGRGLGRIQKEQIPRPEEVAAFTGNLMRG